MSGNLCRCGAYVSIVRAVAAAAAQRAAVGESGWSGLGGAQVTA
jgi:xanthine dehydrogenase YagT iron-sulfur-binding subunit